jgi:hypothetical protein
MRKHIQWHAKIHGKVEICTTKVVEIYEILESRGFGCNAQW